MLDEKLTRKVIFFCSLNPYGFLTVLKLSPFDFVLDLDFVSSV